MPEPSTLIITVAPQSLDLRSIEISHLASRLGERYLLATWNTVVSVPRSPQADAHLGLNDFIVTGWNIYFLTNSKYNS